MLKTNVDHQVADNPKYLHVVDQNTQSKKLLLDEVEKLFDIKWLEWDISDMQLIKSSTPFSDMSFSNDLNKLLNKLEVRYMGKKHGWGLFARGYITKGSVIGVFTGTVALQERNKQITAEHVFISDTPDGKFLIIDGSTCGNVTRFLQHLPSIDNIKDYWFADGVDKSNVAVENVEVIVIELFGASVQTNLFVASRSINRNEIIGCAYDPAFWESGAPTLFSKGGSVIDQKLYKLLSSDSRADRGTIPDYATRHLG